MNYNTKREKLFKNYSQGFKKFLPLVNGRVTKETEIGEVPSTEDVYVCPLCLECFSSELLNQDVENPLTLEDIPPKSVGGKPLILTCKQCNNLSGHSFDHEFVKGIKFLAFRDGDIPIESKLSLNNKNSFKGTLKLNHEKKDFTIEISKKNPYAYSQFNEFNSGSENGLMEYKIPLPHKQKFILSLIRIGYLFAFKKFGYPYVFSPGGEYLRTQVYNKKLELGFKHFLLRNHPLFFGNEGIHVLEKPRDFGAMVIVFNVKLKGQQKQTLALGVPGPYQFHLDNFKAFNAEGNLKARFSVLADIDYISNPSLFFEMWNEAYMED